MATDKTFQTLDLYLSAYLSLHGLQPSLKINNKIIFCFPVSDKLYQLIEQYNSDKPVPVASFVASLKTLRSQMLSLKTRGQA